MQNLSGKTALVTGASEGIGCGCAMVLVQAGANVIINDRGYGGPIAPVKSMEILDIIGARLFIGADIFDHLQAEKLVQEAIGDAGQIDILVTGPASTVRKPSIELEPKEFLETLNDNVVSHWYLAKLVAQDMIRRKSGGRIIFISSIYGALVRENSLPYDTAKAGLNQVTRVLAKEWARHGILVNAIAPGFTDTPGERKLATDEEIEEVVNKLPLRRAGTPKDIGEVAVMLASTKHITGQVLTVAGGHDLVDLYDK